VLIIHASTRCLNECTAALLVVFNLVTVRGVVVHSGKLSRVVAERPWLAHLGEASSWRLESARCSKSVNYLRAIPKRAFTSDGGLPMVTREAFGVTTVPCRRDYPRTGGASPATCCVGRLESGEMHPSTAHLPSYIPRPHDRIVGGAELFTGVSRRVCQGL